MNSFQANTAACASVAVGAGTDVSAGNAGNPGGGTVMEVCGADANPLAANAAWGADVVDVEVASPFFCSLHARTMRTNDTARVMTRLRRALRGIFPPSLDPSRLNVWIDGQRATGFHMEQKRQGRRCRRPGGST